MGIILAGPRCSTQGALGGVVVLFENLISSDDILSMTTSIFDTNSHNYSSRLLMVYSFFIHLIKNWSTHVSLHGTEKDFKYFGSMLMCRKFFGGGTYSLRKFAGNYQEYFQNYNLFVKNLVANVLKQSSANFFETKKLVDIFKRFNANTHWFPNVRPETLSRSLEYNGQGDFKLLYLSQVKESKGILDLIAATGDFEGVSLTVAGKIFDHIIDPEKLPHNTEYIGEISPSDVESLMTKHHALVLPTYYAGEGYPGVIIEAFMVGLPVITTCWNAIPEMVADSAYTVNPRKPLELRNAITMLKSSQHGVYKIKAMERSRLFSDSVVNERYITIIRDIFPNREIS